MKTLLVFYSYTGNTEALAKTLAAVESADATEIKDVVRPGKLKAYFSGCFAAIRGKAWPIKYLDTDLLAYDRIILMSPVWAGNPPPAVNTFLARLPEGKSIFVKMVSGSGHSSCRERIEITVKARGSSLDDFEDIKA